MIVAGLLAAIRYAARWGRDRSRSTTHLDVFRIRVGRSLHDVEIVPDELAVLRRRA